MGSALWMQTIMMIMIVMKGKFSSSLLTTGLRDYHIKKGERIGQGIFMPYLTADSEEQPTAKRTGGFGSTKE